MEVNQNNPVGSKANKVRTIVFFSTFLIFAYFMISSYYRGTFTTDLKIQSQSNTKNSLCNGKADEGRINCKAKNSKSVVNHKDSSKNIHLTSNAKRYNHAIILKETPTTSPMLNTTQNKNWTKDGNLLIKDIISEYHNKGLNLRKKFNCTALFYGEANESKKVEDYLSRHKGDKNITLIPDDQAVKMFKQCDTFKSIRGYAQTAKTEAEKNFPMAFVILMHEGFEQMERLVRTLYQPQNVFCIHVDLKSPDSLYRAVLRFASCFPNVHLASKRLNVTYAHITRLLSDAQCMEDLSKLNHSWRYLVTMAATEFPLRTNKERVDIFTNLNGSNEIREAFGIRIESRYKYRHYVVNGRMKKTLLLKSPPPHNITIVKGRASNAFSRAFVDWFYKDKMAQDLLEWSNDTHSPDEHYWGTLNDVYHNAFLHTPGGYTGHPDTKGYFSSFTLWLGKKANSIPCHGRNRHNICVFSSADLPILRQRMHLCVNKLDLSFDPIAYSCMEETIEYKESHPEPLDLRKYTLKA